MSKVQVDTIVDKDDISAPTFSKGAIVTGVCTATTFVGALTGNADTATTATTTSGNAGGLTGSPSITVTDVGANDVNATGVGTFGSVVSGAISGSTGTFTGDIDIAENIIHTGDTDTKIHFSAADQISFVTGGTTRLNITSGGNLEMPNDTDYIKIGASGDLQLVHTGGVSYISDSGSPLEIRTDTLKIASGVGTEAFRVGGDGQLGVAGANYGTSGQVLTSGGSAASPSWADAGGGEWTLLASGTPTSGTNETITESHFSSTYWRYKVVFNMNCTTQGLFGFQIKNSSGWITSATYFHQQFYNDRNSEISDYYDNGEFMRPFWHADGGRQWRGTLHLWNPSASDGEKYWYYENVQALQQTTYAGSTYFWSGGQPVCGSFRSNTSAITGLRMYMEEGITERCGGGTDTAGVSQWVLYGAKSS